MDYISSLSSWTKFLSLWKLGAGRAQGRAREGLADVISMHEVLTNERLQLVVTHHGINLVWQKTWTRNLNISYKTEHSTSISACLKLLIHAFIDF